MLKGKTDLKDQEETKLVPLEDAVLDKKVTIGDNPSMEEETELIETLAKKQRRLHLVSLRPERSDQGYYTTLP